ncbi:MAG: hypothetical protein BAJALOKI1v1_1550003 [Promethearchaeota archaeon]|nr:MAG: hypothetical protein BAJALOKI1v1_1550003 [Candidatus Lokiarchaeota archaeon]
MAKKQQKDDEIPEGTVDEDGDELINLDDWEDDLEEPSGDNIYEIEDEMLADTTEEEEWGPDRDEKNQMLRDIYCDPCKGSSTKANCKVRDDIGCPPDKAKM